MAYTANQPQHDGKTAVYPPTQDKHTTLKLVVIAACIAILAGGFGALIATVGFPAKNGKVGATGPTGHAGPQGAQGVVGPSGNAATVDTNKMGYCFSVNYTSNSAASWANSVSLSPPTDNNGTLSCTVGQFVSLTPVTPQGYPVPNYAPTQAASTS